jgi:hypothetical protein
MTNKKKTRACVHFFNAGVLTQTHLWFSVSPSLERLRGTGERARERFFERENPTTQLSFLSFLLVSSLI